MIIPCLGALLVLHALLSYDESFGTGYTGVGVFQIVSIYAGTHTESLLEEGISVDSRKKQENRSKFRI